MSPYGAADLRFYSPQPGTSYAARPLYRASVFTLQLSPVPNYTAW